MIIDGKKIADDIADDIKNRMEALRGETPTVSLISISQTEAGESFVAAKKKFGEDVGIKVTVHSFSEADDPEVVRLSVGRLVRESDSVVIQLPLPKRLNDKELLNLIPPEKDPDLLSRSARESFVECKSSTLPPVAGAVKEVLKRSSVDYKSKKVVVIGKGQLVGLPVAAWFRCQGVLPVVLDKGDPLKETLLQADIVVSGAGSPGLVRTDMVKEGAILIDAGTSGQSGEIVGDIDPKCAEKASIFTPVPGGIGPITVAILFFNIIKLKGL